MIRFTLLLEMDDVLVYILKGAVMIDLSYCLWKLEFVSWLWVLCKNMECLSNSSLVGLIITILINLDRKLFFNSDLLMKYPWKWSNSIKSIKRRLYPSFSRTLKKYSYFHSDVKSRDHLIWFLRRTICSFSGERALRLKWKEADIYSREIGTESSICKGI